MRTFGTLARSEKKNWVLNAEPHVIIKAKRLFTGASQNKQGRIYLSDTVETCRELDWFRDRYPVEMSPADEAYLVNRAAEHRERESLVAQLMAGTAEPRAFELAIPPRDYQKVAAELALRTGQLLLADDMGLGKTISAICMVSDPRARPALVVTLTSLCKQWQREIQRFAPGLSTHILKKGTPYDLTLSRGAKRGQMTMPGAFPDVIIGTYSKLAGWADTLAPLIKSVVYDECVTADTRVALWPPGSGEKAIVALEPGDAIASFDASGTIVRDEVACVVAKGMREVWRIELENGSHLDCTPNERLLTCDGWVHAQDLIDAFSNSNEAVTAGAAHRVTAPVGAGQSSGRRQPKPRTDLPAPRFQPLSQSGGLRHAQGAGASTVRKDMAEDRPKPGFRQRELPVQNGDDPILRVLTLSVLTSGGRSDAQDSDRRVVGPADMGGCGLLVHGRRAPADKVRSCNDQHPLVLPRRERTPGQLARCAGGGCGHRPADDPIGEEVCIAPTAQARHAAPGGDDQAVRPIVHGLQGRDPRGAAECPMRGVWSGAPGKADGNAGDLRGAAVPKAAIQSLVGRKERISDGEDLLRLPGECQRPRHALPYVQKSIRESGEASEVRPDAPAAAPEVRLLRCSCAEGARRFDSTNAMLPRQGVPDKASPVAQVSRIEPSRVTRITPLGVLDVWDIETVQHHTLFANGFAVHNCQDLRAGDSTNKGVGAKVLSEAASIRMGTSGTPIYNMGSEIHAVLGFVAPDALGTREEFLREWCGAVDARGRARLRDPKAFGAHVRETGLMLRRTCADVGRELPPEIRIPHHIQVDDGPLKDITSAAIELAKIIKDASNPSFARMQAGGDLDAMVRQATGVAKAAYVAEFVRMLLEQDQPVLLCGWHRSVYDIWLERLAEYKPALYTGSESASQKDKARARFVDGDTNLMIMSLRSGVGLDGLQHRCRTVVFGELDWSPGVHEQVLTRLKRDEQKEQVIAYYLIADEGSDPIVADILQVKRTQVEGIRNPSEDIIEQLDVSGNRIRELAEAYLKKANGRAAPPKAKPAQPTAPQRPELVQKSLL